MGAIGWISNISATAIGIVTAALVCVMAVYSGYVAMILSGSAQIDPDLLIEPTSGAVYDMSDSRIQRAIALPVVAYHAPLLTTRGVVKLSTQEQVVELVGVDPALDSVVLISDSILEGRWLSHAPSPPDAIPVVLGLGVASRQQSISELLLTLPRRQGLINPLAPASAFRSAPLAPVGILSPLREDVDMCVYMPIDSLRQLLSYAPTEVGAIAIRVAEGVAVETAQSKLQSVLGAEFRVLDREAQHPELTMLIRVERLMIYAIMLFILVLAAFSLASSLTMLMIEKRSDLMTLSAMGATRSQRMSIFTTTGLLISMIGCTLGLAVGVGMALLQQQFSLLTVQTGLAEVPFPVDLRWEDLALIIVASSVISLLTSLIPSTLLERGSTTLK